MLRNFLDCRTFSVFLILLVDLGGSQRPSHALPPHSQVTILGACFKTCETQVKELGHKKERRNIKIIHFYEHGLKHAYVHTTRYQLTSIYVYL